MTFTHFWRLVLTLSLVLTLPLQGYAAARMVSCDAVLASALAATVSTVGESEAEAHTAGLHHVDGMQHDMGMQHDIGTQHDVGAASAHDAAHTAHGGSCMSCTPCSPGATLTCVLPIAATFFSARVLSPLVVPPVSADLAHPERPPQTFLL